MAPFGLNRNCVRMSLKKEEGEFFYEYAEHIKLSSTEQM
jgi:hypothetical protein